MKVPEMIAYFFLRDKTIAELLRDGLSREEVTDAFGVPALAPLRRFKERLRVRLWELLKARTGRNK